MQKKPSGKTTHGEIRVVDLFCGCGGLSLGIEEACRALEYKFTPVLGADIATAALDLYKKNFAPQYAVSEPIEKQKHFVEMVGRVDILIGGPPCQGNSDLNNHTRRNDPRNLLYLRMIRCVELLSPKYILIENVPGVQHDTHNVVDTAKSELTKMGWRG